MIRRILLLITLVGALGAGVVIAGSVVQKDKAKSKDQTDKELQKDKDAATTENQGLFALEMGGYGGYLGVYLEEVTSERSKELGLKEERGAVVMKVVSGSPAEKAGLKENDVVVSFNGRRVDSVRELQRLLNETPADRTIQIEVIRGGSKQTLAATLTKRSLQSYRILGPDFDGKFMEQNQEAMKKFEQSLKESQEALKGSREKLGALSRDFGDFTFVNPGEFSFFGGRRFGINAESLTDQLAEFFGVKDSKGVLVVSVEENSVAAKAGIKAGDVIIAVGDEKVDSVRSFIKALSGKDEGTFPVKIVRNRVEQTVNVTFEKRELPTPRRRAVAYLGRAAVI
ncbi:MAG TPA: PDZ domain-containing protein [Blastocatellia bacterium]|nr:PDZ domain-containing protein [Blastocatellia bacterium]